MNTEPISPKDWDELIARLPNAHLLQTWEWGQVKAQFGWMPETFIWRDESQQVCATALVLKRELGLRGFSANLKLLYIPRGPLLDWNNSALRERVIGDLKAYGRKIGAMFVKMDPEVILALGQPGTADDQIQPLGREIEKELSRTGWHYSTDQIQFRNTVMLDLRGSEADWLTRMKQKTRYNLRLAQKKGVSVRRGTSGDFSLLYRMYAETSVRDGFVIRPQSYYETVWRGFMARDMACPLIAEVEGEPVAAVFVFWFAAHAWYIYGMSRDLHREKMPNYVLQWEAMRLANEKGCVTYDLWGAPESFDESDSMWGVYRFKEGLGGRVVRSLGAWDYPIRPFWFNMYTRLLPRILNWMRNRGKARTRQEISL
ncbi:MAG TPA: peptidoglycan bridge formation glycyltransferase FemA/FemB family protein [Longilinea sp.]|nr:peptidoglycan bridge formation glycyltransferase FemA/FemB family protein [Longilinea sp.]